MKRLLLILFGVFFGLSLYAQTTIGDLTQVSSLSATDALVIEQTDSTRKALISDMDGRYVNKTITGTGKTAIITNDGNSATGYLYYEEGATGAETPRVGFFSQATQVGIQGINRAGTDASIRIDTLGAITITDAINSKGAVYNADYSSNFTNRSLPDVGYVSSTYLAQADTVTLASVAYLLNDTIPAFVFGAGAGEAGDTVLFAKDDRGFGMLHNVNDTLYAVSAELIRISAGDSLTFNIYWGNGMTLTATDSLFNSPEAVGPNQSTLTIDDPEIPPGQDVWIELRADQVLTNTPNEFILQLNKRTIRD
jgi:hypothetical protein